MVRKRKIAQPYLVAVLAAFAALLVRVLLWDVLGTTIPYMTFFPAVLLSAWFGGFRAGLLCTATSGMLATYFLIEPFRAPTIRYLGDFVRLGIFLGVGVFFSWLMQRMRNAEAAEKRSRLLAEQTLASIGDAVVAVNRKQCITFINGAAVELTGWTSEEAMGQPVKQIVRFRTDDSEKPWETFITTALDSGTFQQRSESSYLIAKDGRETPVEDSVAAIRDTDGEVVGAVLVIRDVSTRRQADKALLESRERLQTTLESIADAFMALSSDWRFNYVNTAAERWLGKTRESLVGQNHWDVYPDMLGTPLEEEYRRVMHDRKPTAFDFYSKRSNRWLEMNVYPAQDGGISIYFRDITMRKEAQAALAQSRAETERARDLLQTTLASIGDGVIATDSETRVTFINSVAASLMATDPEDAVGKPLEEIFAIVNESTRKPVDTPASRAIREGMIVGLANHTILIAKGGAEIPIDDSAAPIRDAEGTVIGAVLVFRDVTGRRAAEKALTTSEERLRLALRVGEIGVWDWDVAANRITWSERVYVMHGLQPGEFSGRVEDLNPLIHEEDRANVQRAIRSALETGSHYQVQLRALHPNGTVRWLETSGQVIRDDEGKPVRMIGATTDITERVQTEAEARQQARELERSNADLERFAIAASHDLQEPLRMVTIYSQLMNRRCQETLDEDSLNYLQIILDATKRMRTLIQDLLAYSQVTHEQRAVALVDAGAVLEQVVQNCETAVRESGAVVQCGALPMVYARASQLSQVFQNLLINAIRYRSAAEPYIEVSAKQSGREWVFAVRDNGIGIPPQQHGRVFELFKRLDSKSAGTGIGLALCQRIVDGHGGRIWVESEPGRGSTFYFTLPLVPDFPSTVTQRRSDGSGAAPA